MCNKMRKRCAVPKKTEYDYSNVVKYPATECEFPGKLLNFLPPRFQTMSFTINFHCLKISGKIFSSQI